MSVTQERKIGDNSNPEGERAPQSQRSRERQRGLRGVAVAAGALVVGAVVAVVAFIGPRQTSGAGHGAAPRPAPSSTGHPKAPQPVSDPTKSTTPTAVKPRMFTPALTSAAAAYNLPLRTVGYDAYIAGTQKYAAAEKLPNQYYDMTKLTGHLALSDFRKLAPVLVNNGLLSLNTVNPHFLDIGSHTNFANAQPTKPWDYLVSTELPVEDGFQTGLDSFAQGKVSVEMAPYDGPFANYDGSQVITVNIKGVPVQDISTSDGHGGYIDDTSSRGNYPGMSFNGPNVSFHLQYSPGNDSLINNSEFLEH